MCLIKAIGYHGDRDWSGVSIEMTPLNWPAPKSRVLCKQIVRIFNDAKVIAVQTSHRV